MAVIDYDYIECPNPSCDQIGMMPDGGFDYVCSVCGTEGTVLGEDGYELFEGWY